MPYLLITIYLISNLLINERLTSNHHMKTGTVIAIGLGAAAVWYYSQLGVAAAVVQVVFSGVTIRSLTDYTLNFMIQNVSNATIELNSMTGVVSVNGNPLGNVSEFKLVQVPPNSQAPMNIDFEVSLLSLPGDIEDIVNNKSGNNNLDFKVVGNMNVNNLVLPLTVEQTVTY